MLLNRERQPFLRPTSNTPRKFVKTVSELSGLPSGKVLSVTHPLHAALLGVPGSSISNVRRRTRSHIQELMLAQER